MDPNPPVFEGEPDPILAEVRAKAELFSSAGIEVTPGENPGTYIIECNPVRKVVGGEAKLFNGSRGQSRFTAVEGLALQPTADPRISVLKVAFGDGTPDTEIFCAPGRDGAEMSSEQIDAALMNVEVAEPGIEFTVEENEPGEGRDAMVATTIALTIGRVALAQGPAIWESLKKAYAAVINHADLKGGTVRLHWGDKDKNEIEIKPGKVKEGWDAMTKWVREKVGGPKEDGKKEEEKIETGPATPEVREVQEKMVVIKAWAKEMSDLETKGALSKEGMQGLVLRMLEQATGLGRPEGFEK